LMDTRNSGRLGKLYMTRNTRQTPKKRLVMQFGEIT